MKKIHTTQEMKNWVASQRKLKKTIGFVPTMGALHAGHLSLIKQCKADNDICVASVFVNPTQFNNPEDLEKYPRHPEKDAELLESVDCDAVFFPTVEDIYPEGEKSETFDFNGLENQMEGKFRPGHFDGVGTIVNKFFEIIQPDRAYFGEKDFQQLRIIQTMVEKKGHHIEIVPMPIFREDDGLAMSSRNQRLSPEFRNASPRIYEILKEVNSLKNDFSPQEVKQRIEELFAQTDLELEYFVICDEETLHEINDWKDSENIRAFVAAYAGDIRLIDNLKID
ncbi:pantoate--beta-alanine ligase [Ornithobacterium rhinotracheale]|uniref:pantoate--beta-alanine ligase n=1 Tax=Ornithobacterium rhinotracheale TaxID=28251 RepID=UPI00129D17E1|nr:pantoate--beta-alanine ligase [Ornithobacterium rhinotracheale]MRJ07347.1 pantoate--beta-alanine ligase [Ornithobacterium rhinotracheale]UOH77948.1 pantoate--beta-alanine ligase [Ornithobacterium rhinotracheale]